MFSIAVHRGKNLLECRIHPLQCSAVMSSHAAFMASNRDIWSCGLWSTYHKISIYFVWQNILIEIWLLVFYDHIYTWVHPSKYLLNKIAAQRQSLRSRPKPEDAWKECQRVTDLILHFTCIMHVCLQPSLEERVDTVSETSAKKLLIMKM